MDFEKCKDYVQRLVRGLRFSAYLEMKVEVVGNSYEAGAVGSGDDPERIAAHPKALVVGGIYLQPVLTHWGNDVAALRAFLGRDPDRKEMWVVEVETYYPGYFNRRTGAAETPSSDLHEIGVFTFQNAVRQVIMLHFKEVLDIVEENVCHELAAMEAAEIEALEE